MSETQIGVPDFFDISTEAQAAAASAMDNGKPLIPPADAQKATDKKGNVYYRWTEGAVIENAWRDGKDGLVTAIIQYKVRSGYQNENQRNWARYTINPALLMGTETDPDKKKKHEFMNNVSINAINSLLDATGLAPKKGKDGKHVPLKGTLLNHIFPEKNKPGVTSPLVGKTAMFNFSDSPNAEGQKHNRRTNVESYLIDVPVA